MNKPTSKQDKSPLVQSVLNLDLQFSNLNRLSAQISEMELKSEFDFKQVRLLMNRFSESAEIVSTEIVELAAQLNQARVQAESAANLVAKKTEIHQARQDVQDEKTNAFLALTQKVHKINEALKDLKKDDGQPLTDAERTELSMRLSELQIQLQPMIDEALEIKKDAQESKMKVLEQNSESLSQSLIAISQKLTSFNDVAQ
jgi:chromosome segregation ATPase